MAQEVSTNQSIVVIDVNYGYGLTKILLAYYLPLGVSSGLESEVGRLSTLFSLTHKEN